MNKLPSPSIGHDVWHPELETSHMILALLQEMSNSSAAVQGNHLSPAGTLLHHRSTRAVAQSSHVIRDEEIIAGRHEDLFLEMLEQCDIWPWTGSECLDHKELLHTTSIHENSYSVHFVLTTSAVGQQLCDASQCSRSGSDGEDLFLEVTTARFSILLRLIVLRDTDTFVSEWPKAWATVPITKSALRSERFTQQKWQIIATSKRVQICLIFGM